MIAELLHTGRDNNAIPGRELAERLNVEESWLEWPVTEERYQGAPICYFLFKGEKRYYLAADKEELLCGLCEARAELQTAGQGKEYRKALRNYRTLALFLKRLNKGEVKPWQKSQMSK